MSRRLNAAASLAEPNDLISDAAVCERCSGTGELSRGRMCPDCDGVGLIGDDPWADDEMQAL
ncbi:hypothetical protein ACFXG4_27370 [Nocardia sp. NPDC059246]|uniref:hypothetical protein n=1 Tax=unclassified Nocardia TaxID=2637762 RepID=UPI0036AD73E9